MPATTPAQGFPYPVGTDDPDVADDMMKLAKAVDKRVMGIYPTATERNAWTTAAGLEEGMFAYTRDTNTVQYYDGTSWVNFPTPPPAITSGTSVPSNASGANNDVYFKV